MSRIDQLQAFLKESPKDSFITFAIAKEHEKANDLVQAEAYYRSIEQNEPEYVGMYYHLGKLLFIQNRLQEAWDIYTCLLYTSPSPRDRTRSRMPSSA